MAETIREQIISDGIMVVLANITIANGYNTNIGKNVLRALKPVGDDFPVCVVWPQDEEVSQHYGKNNCLMPVRVEGLIEKADHGYEGMAYLGETNPSIASEKILGDLIKCLTDPTTIDDASNSLADGVKYVSGGPGQYSDAGDEIAGAYVVIEVKYLTMSGDPYSQS